MPPPRFKPALAGFAAAVLLAAAVPRIALATAPVERAAPCTYRAGVLDGRRDDRAQSGCGGRDYSRGYSLGQRLHRLDQALEDVRYDIHDVHDQLGNRSRRGDASGLSLYLNRLEMRSAQIQARIRQLESEARSNGSGPLPNPQHEFYYH